MVGTLLMVLLAVGLAVPVGVMAVNQPAIVDSRPAVFSVSATPDGRIQIIHEAGPELNVRGISIRITIDGTPLRYQPPIPFFAAKGFRAGPTGPFNIATDQAWTVGEPASVQLASTNHPKPESGDTVTVRILREEVPIAVIETTV